MRLLSILLMAVVAAGVVAVVGAGADGAVPVVTSVSPGSGLQAGGTSVTITGSGFSGATGVKFGGRSAAFSVQSDSSVVATTPPGSGTADVFVDTPAGENSAGAGDKFDYLAPPVVAALAPDSGSVSGGTVVTITGQGFAGASAVLFGDEPAQAFTVDSDSQITATTPKGGGDVHVSVTTAGGTNAASAADVYIYRIAVTSVDPGSGPAGTAITVHGIGFAVATSVRLGDSWVGHVIHSDTTMLVVPLNGSGTAQLVVVTPYGSSATGPNTSFTFVPAGTNAAPTDAPTPSPRQTPSPSTGPPAPAGTQNSARTAVQLTGVGPPVVRVRAGMARVVVRVRVNRAARVSAFMLGRSTSLTVRRAGLASLRLVLPSATLRPTTLYRIRVSAAAGQSRATLLLSFRR